MAQRPRNLSRLNILGALLALAGAIQVVAGAFANPVSFRPLFMLAGGVQLAAGLLLVFWPRIGGRRER
jgi:uncharacterized membrane protein HdeD (DUF308 family)